MSTSRDRVSTGSPFEPLIGFSRAARAGPIVAVSGTGPVDAAGDSVPGDAEDQARRCFEIAIGALEALGGQTHQVIRTRMYLVDAKDWTAVGRAHAAVFGQVQPAATMVVVAALLRPEWRVEIELEAWSPRSEPAG